ncbi:MAG: molybdopterin-dependent oxidoreductase [Spirochaetes bacterium]|nr:molybdopterin-dependent oxidoreductase [Spirochaetota bacterium]
MAYKAGICTFCGNGCGHLLKIQNGKTAGVYPLRNHPVSKGRLCVRGWNIHELLSSPHRITTALMRKNGNLTKVNLDEAIFEVVTNLKKYAGSFPDSIAVIASPRSSNEENYLLMKFARTVLKTNNIGLDSEGGHRASLDVLYAGTGFAGMLGSVKSIGGADFIFVIDFDITKQNPILGSELHKAKRAGAFMVSLDSRVTQIVKLSNVCLMAKPGSHKVVIAALGKILIDDGLVDNAYIQKYTSGFEGFANLVGSLTYDDIQKKTGLSIDVLRDIAARLVRSKRAMAFYPSGISGLDSETIGYLFNLFLLAGKIGVNGSSVNPVTGINNLQGGYDMGVAPDLLPGYQPIQDARARSHCEKVWGMEIPAKKGTMPQLLLADPNSKIKALVVVDHDDGIVRYAEKLKKLEYIVYIGAFENPFTEFAHAVLPIAMYIESDGTYTNTERRIQLSEKKVEAPAGVLPGWKLYAELAKKAGIAWNYTSAADVMKEIASVTPQYSGISYEKLKKTFGIQWPCDAKNPEGKECFLADEAEKKLAFYPLKADFSVSQPNDSYPFQLMIGKAQHFWHQNNLMRLTKIPLREYNTTLLLYPEGYVEISPDDAKKLGVRDKWPVLVKSQAGEMKAQAKISDEIPSGTAYIPYFIQENISTFLLEHRDVLGHGEDATISVKIEKV